jgi:hypothetical protein
VSLIYHNLKLCRLHLVRFMPSFRFVDFLFPFTLCNISLGLEVVIHWKFMIM